MTTSFSDILSRGVFPKENVRFAFCQARRLCTEGMRRLRPDWLSGWLFGEALTCATACSVMLKTDERFTLRWDYEGPVGSIVVDCSADPHVRGYPKHLRLLEKNQTVAEVLGEKGLVSVSSSYPSRLGRTGTTATVFQDISLDLAHFFSLSFQVETALVTGLVMPPRSSAVFDSAQTLLLQPLPGADLEVFEVFRRKMEQPAFRERLEKEPQSLEEVCQYLGVDDVNVLSQTEPIYHCGCSQERGRQMLLMLEQSELHDMLSRDGKAEIICHFCATTYHYSAKDLEGILAESMRHDA